MNTRYLLQSAAERLDADVEPLLIRDPKTDAVTSIGAGVWFAGDLEQISSKLLTVHRPPLNGMKLFPVSSEVIPGARQFTRRMVELLGYASMIADYADDLPAADAVVSSETVDIKDLGSSFMYNLSEIEAARAAAQIRRGPGISLQTQRAFAARKANETKVNDIVWHGLPEAGLYGVLTTPSVPRYVIGIASAGATMAAVDATVTAICSFFNGVSDDTGTAEQANRLLMSAKLHNSFGTRFRTNTDSSILDQIVKGCSGLKSVDDIIPVRELDGAGDAGGDALIADSRDEGVMSIVLPKPLDQRPAQERNLAWKVNVVTSCGGVTSDYPQGMKIGEMTNAL